MKPIARFLLIVMLPVLAACTAGFLASDTGEAETPSDPAVAIPGTFPCASTDGTYTSFNYPTPLTPGLPCNVDTEAVGKAQNVAQEQRFFDIYSWQSFLALMWPTTEGGESLQATLTAPGSPRWEYWKESYQVYRDNGQTPQPWDAPRSQAPVCSNAQQLDSTRSVLYRTNKLVHMSGPMTVADERNQAFTYPLVDQSGDVVRYEVLLNYDEFQYLVENQLFNINGQIAFSQGENIVNFPSGDNAQQRTGAVEVKMAWKVLTPEDPADRYYTRQAYVANADGTCSEATVGLVGTHISHKTQQNKQWVWATFEHVDNVATNQLAMVPLRNGQKGKLRPSFNDPDCPTCPVNVLPPTSSDGVQPPTQVTRVIPIAENTQQLNGQAQALLAEMGSVLQYYELVGTQWPTDEDAPPAATNQFNDPGDPAYEQVDNKPGGNPHPVFLINTTMETYLQKGNQTAQLQIQGFPFNETPIFATESCMGCHYSAGVAVDAVVDDYGQRQVVYGPASSGDFSWLLQLKATWKQTDE